MAKKKINSEATQGRRTSPRLASQRASLQSNGKATVLKNNKPDHDGRSAPIPTVKEELNDGRALETVKEMSNNSNGAASRIKEMSNDSKVAVASIKEMPNDSKVALACIKEISNDDKLVVSRIKDMSNESKGAVSRVKETLRIFNEHYLHFVQEQEKGCENGEIIDQKAANGSKRKKMSPDEKNEKRTVKRFDLNALTKMREAKQVLYPQKRIGNIPGIDVGFRFYSRAEMVAVGLHSHLMNGIDYMDASYKKLVNCNKGVTRFLSRVELIKPRDIVYECGPNCGCGPGCINRVSQRGIKHKLEVFKTSEKGWAVRSRGFILPGAPVCEYTGTLRRTNEIDNESHNDYIFEIDCLHTMKGIGGRERSIDGSVRISNQDDKIDDNSPELCIDEGSQGNVARFINHSCEPNLFVQCVLSTHDDPKLARVVLVAAENISPFEELTYDYGYQLNSVVGPDGKVIKLACHCGAADCRKRLY